MNKNRIGNNKNIVLVANIALLSLFVLLVSLNLIYRIQPTNTTNQMNSSNLVKLNDYPVFTDQALERVVKSILEVPEGESLTYNQLNSLMEIRVYGNYVTKNTDDVMYITSGELYQGIYYQGIVVNGVELTSERGQIKRLDDLAMMPNLKELIIINNCIEDISGLSGFTTLKHVYLSDNYISDISPIKDINISELNLINNDIYFIDALSGSKGNFTILNFDYNEIARLDALCSHDELIRVSFRNNNIFEIPDDFDDTLVLNDDMPLYGNPVFNDIHYIEN